MAQAWPHLEITLADLPGTAAVAKRYMEEAGVAGRVHLKPTDVVSEALPSAPCTPR